MKFHGIFFNQKLKHMNIKSLFSDLRSGIVVFLVALPLCLGIAMACSVPLFSGIIAGIIGGIVVTSVSGSRYSVSGPAAGLTAIVITAISDLGSYECFIAAALLAGLLQVVLGALKAGRIGNYIPGAVIKGMLAGIGIILVIKQLPHFVGYDADPEGDMYFARADGHNSLSDLFYMINFITPGSLLIGCLSFVILLVTDQEFYKKNKILSLFPGPLLVVLSGILLSSFFSSDPFFKIGPDHLVNLPEINSIEDLKSNFMFPDFSKSKSREFWSVVFTLAIVASLETLLSLEAIEKLDPRREPIDSDKELMAQGAGNMLSAIIGGLPITSVIVRSSANLNAGAKTRLSVIFHAVLLIISVLFFPGILGMIPNSSLAVILIMTGYKLAKVSLFKKQFKMGWDQFVPFMVTIVIMLITDLLKGVAAGILVALYYIIRHNITSSFEVMEELIEGKRNYLIKLPQHITFFNKGFISNYLDGIKKGSRVIIDGSINKSTDKDVKEVLTDFVETSGQKNIEIQFVKYTIE
jgi:MFS superfamily sulfate permease-like transporter